MFSYVQHHDKCSENVLTLWYTKRSTNHSKVLLCTYVKRRRSVYRNWQCTRHAYCSAYRVENVRIVKYEAWAAVRTERPVLEKLKDRQPYHRWWTVVQLTGERASNVYKCCTRLHGTWWNPSWRTAWTVGTRCNRRPKWQSLCVGWLSDVPTFAVFGRTASKGVRSDGVTARIDDRPSDNEP